MAFIDHILACNKHDMTRFRPFKVAGQSVGWVGNEFISSLARRPELFMIQPHAVTLSPALDTPAARTEAMEQFLEQLRGEGKIDAWRGERYPVTNDLAQPPLMEMERAAVVHFGLRAYGVHLTGYVKRNGTIFIWVARRSRTKPTYPGMLDNTVAGGQPAGIGLIDNMIKECGEEASIPKALALQAKPIGIVTYCLEHRDGLKPDVLYNFDLELPADFTPHPHDDEIESFELWPAQDVMARVRDTFDFKFNCNLVLIDFFIRHGLIGPDEPDYVALCAGLHSFAAGAHR
jgi:isopentenyldiphosphate isomerase